MDLKKTMTVVIISYVIIMIVVWKIFRGREIKDAKISVGKMANDIHEKREKFFEKKDIYVTAGLLGLFLLMFYGVSRLAEGNDILLEACYVVCEILLVMVCIYPIYVLWRKLKVKETREKDLEDYALMNIRNWYFMPPVKNENRYDVIVKKSHSPVQHEIWYAIDKRFFIEKSVGEGLEAQHEVEEIDQERFFSEISFIITTARATNSDDYMRMLMQAQEYLSDHKIVTHLKW